MQNRLLLDPSLSCLCPHVKTALHALFLTHQEDRDDGGQARISPLYSARESRVFFTSSVLLFYGVHLRARIFTALACGRKKVYIATFQSHVRAKNLIDPQLHLLKCSEGSEAAASRIPESSLGYNDDGPSSSSLLPST